MDGVVALLALAAVVGVWWLLAKRMKAGGKGWFSRQLAGSTAGVFSGLVVVACALQLGVIKSVEETSSKPAISYTITQDEFREGRPRKVEATLPRRLTDSELAEVAKAIREDSKFDADRTFIGFRVEGQTESTYWANASFDPDYESTLIGLSADDYQKLSAVDLAGYPSRVGSWLRDGALGHVMVLYTKDGKYFIDSVFSDGGKNTEEYLAQKLPDGGLRLELPENNFNEHYMILSDGTLQGWGENGVYLTLPPMAASTKGGDQVGNG
ncbi:zinc ribbon domain-containing protein [Pseudomonas sp. BN415]|uniref:zinc ribbon domain-containing protein n=1 Tax=Pseudomonas sp. BN415 TaxID=2567889 RepID=UPI00245897D1|nr:zinc ribbon domain-containing protein [Pseudomonas sp. BN415]MDH4585621.1 zinc ribbon domain-containing protein [Pseudomonas sp. BN415]